MTTNSEPPVDNKRFQRWLRVNFRSVLPQFIILIFLSLFAIGIQLLNPWPLKVLIDSVFGDVPAPGFLENFDQPALLLIVSSSYILIYILSGLISIVDQYLTEKYSLRLAIGLKSHFFHHIFQFTRPVRRKIQSGDYVYRLNQETDYLPALLFSTLTAILTGFITIVAASAILLMLDAGLAVYSLFILPLLYLSIKYFTPRIESRSNQIEIASSEIYNYSNESIENAEIIQAFNREAYQTEILKQTMIKRLRLELKLNLLEGGFEFSNNLFTSIGIGLIVALGGQQVLHHTMTMGELLIFITYMSYFYDPLESMVSNFGVYKSSIAGLKRVFSILVVDSNKAVLEKDKAILSKSKGSIEFENVNFSYGRHRVLKDVSFKIASGQKVAFVGPSGSGKSSIISLLMGFNQHDSGTISIDDQDLRGLNLHSVRSEFGFVAQEAALFSGTVADNIMFAKPGPADYKAILSAADAANATEFIVNLPDQFQTNIGESGDNLSGGQKQRISIARAFLKDASMLLLDEPTSSQDTESGVKIITAIKKLMVGRTVLLVSHELSLLREMDTVYVVDKGVVKDISEYGGIESYIYTLITQPPIDA